VVVSTSSHEWDVVCAYSGVEGVIHVIMRGQ
jgi:hypothetical protein